MKTKTFACLSLVTLLLFFGSATQGQTYSVIYRFSGENDGSFPTSGVTIKDGVLYGTTSGVYTGGGVYELIPMGSSWSIIPIHLFNGSDGSDPTARVIFGPDGHLYGTTSAGGTYNFGTVFELIPPTVENPNWQENTLYSFAGGADGAMPFHGDLAWDQQGNMYGTTYIGGTHNYGTVFQMTKSGDTWTKTTIHSFSGSPSDGWGPANGVVVDSHGNLFGTTVQGGYLGAGTVFELAYVQGVGWEGTILHSFNGTDGINVSGVVFDNSGNLYGTTAGESGPEGHAPTAFELSPANATARAHAALGALWTFNVLYTLPQGGIGPLEAVALDPADNLYNVTYSGGACGLGNVFRLTNTSNGWIYTSLHEFFCTSINDGKFPKTNVTVGEDGTLYGTTEYGGGFRDDGTVWMIKP